MVVVVVVVVVGSIQCISVLNAKCIQALKSG